MQYRSFCIPPSTPNATHSKNAKRCESLLNRLLAYIFSQLVISGMTP
uniref:Uncharacterized protein n=1 Tax=Vibrio splendidus TaxID=29497 RepID=B8YG23_VIBSP|nr:unknown [Vibrio splendidus]